MHDSSGDRLLAKLHGARGLEGRGLVVLVHGLTGCEDSFYIQASAKHWLKMRLCGAAPEPARRRPVAAPLSVQQYHAGRSGDLRDALYSLTTLEPSRSSTRVFSWLAILSAETLLLALLWRRRRRAFRWRLRSSVSAPIDLKAAQRRIMEGPQLDLPPLSPDPDAPRSASRRTRAAWARIFGARSSLRRRSTPSTTRSLRRSTDLRARTTTMQALLRPAGSWTASDIRHCWSMRPMIPGSRWTPTVAIRLVRKSLALASAVLTCSADMSAFMGAATEPLGTIRRPGAFFESLAQGAEAGRPREEKGRQERSCPPPS